MSTFTVYFSWTLMIINEEFKKSEKAQISTETTLLKTTETTIMEDHFGSGEEKCLHTTGTTTVTQEPSVQARADFGTERSRRNFPQIHPFHNKH